MTTTETTLFKEKVLKDLNIQEQSWEETCGVVRGSYNGGIRYACTRCEILVEMTTDEIKTEMGEELYSKHETIKDPITEKGWIPAQEMVVRNKFLEKAKEHNCGHFEKRLEYSKDPKTHQTFGMLALMKMIKNK
jgi:hypothetical protein